MAIELSDATSSGEAQAQAQAQPLPPLVIVEGFLSRGESVVWGTQFPVYLGRGADAYHAGTGARPGPGPGPGAGAGDRQVVFAPIGPVSSLHDRACELYYALRGGTVDYGEQHAAQHGHARFGRHYATPLIDRSTTRIHLLGHSLGGPTIMKLQQLLRDRFFPAPARDTELLVLSITAVSAPFLGTPIVYSLGSEPLPYPKVRPLSIGNLITKLVHIATYLDLPFFDTHADAWHFSPRFKHTHGDEQKALSTPPLPGLRGLLKQLWHSDWAVGRDCAAWDAAVLNRDESEWPLPSPSSGGVTATWYRSYAGHLSSSFSLYALASYLVSRFDYAPHFPDRVQHPDWIANDGVIPLASQFHPGKCDPNVTCIHSHAMPPSAAGAKSTPSPNIWHTHVLENTDHSALCPFWTGSERQKEFWTGVGAWLASIDHAAGYYA